MIFAQILLYDSIKDHHQEFKELYKLAETISKSEGSLDVLARKVNNLVKKDNIFLLDPLVRWVIAAECLSGDEEFFRGLGEAVKKRKGKTTPHGALELKRLKLVINAIMDAQMAQRIITPRELRKLCEKAGLWKGDQYSNESFRKWLARNKHIIRSAFGPIEIYEFPEKGKESVLHKIEQRKIKSLKILPPQYEIDFLQADLRVLLNSLPPSYKTPHPKKRT